MPALKLVFCSVYGTSVSPSSGFSLQQNTTLPVQAMTDLEKGQSHEETCTSYYTNVCFSTKHVRPRDEADAADDDEDVEGLF